jgi:hypothetical protein
VETNTEMIMIISGLTALLADEVYDILERDYPEKFQVIIYAV